MRPPVLFDPNAKSKRAADCSAALDMYFYLFVEVLFRLGNDFDTTEQIVAHPRGLKCLGGD